MRDIDTHFDSVAQQATLAEAGGLAKPRSVLLLWFLRNVIGIDELEAYDHVCDGDRDKGIDGLFLERGAGEQSPDTLMIFQSKYSESPDAKVGANDIDRLAGAALWFTSQSTLENLMSSGAEPTLVELIDVLGLRKAFTDSEDSSPIEVRLVLVTTGTLNGDAQKKVDALRESKGQNYIDIWDVKRLGPIANAVKSPDRLQQQVSISIDPEILITGDAPNRVGILPVQAKEIVAWPGIEDRQLFALNVRHELRSNRVSKAIDGAISREADHANFLAYHNGLTVICDQFEVDGESLVVHNPSVVNGAQSVLAFCRGAQASCLSDELRVFVKIVEVKDRPLLEREVSRRSNTQTGVNPRNLMANHGTQLRLSREFENQYAGIAYETRPDVGTGQAATVIRNDDAAQLLCAIYNEWPWLAVKKTSLFEPEHHPHIFSERIHAHHVLFADRIRSAVQGRIDMIPDDYRSSWLLTRVVACYLVGQILRESQVVPDLLLASRDELEDSHLIQQLSSFAHIAATSLRKRHDELVQLVQPDHFRKDFKNPQQLISLGASARALYQTYELWKSSDIT